MFPLRDNIPSKRFPLVNYLLIAANIAAFLYEVKLANFGLLESFIMSHGLVPNKFFASPLDQVPSIFVSMFMHGSWGHVLGNMWFLFIFGDNVEGKLGHVRYLIYYLLVGVGAAAAQLFMNQASALPMVGASGAIAGVLGGYLIMFPGARILTFFIFIIFIRFIEVPAFLYLLFWFFIQALNGFGSLTTPAMRGEMGGVAWWAHAGGFASGFILVSFFRKR